MEINSKDQEKMEEGRRRKIHGRMYRSVPYVRYGSKE